MAEVACCGPRGLFNQLWFCVALITRFLTGDQSAIIGNKYGSLGVPRRPLPPLLLSSSPLSVFSKLAKSSFIPSGPARQINSQSFYFENVTASSLERLSRFHPSLFFSLSPSFRKHRARERWRERGGERAIYLVQGFLKTF